MRSLAGCPCAVDSTGNRGALLLSHRDGHSRSPHLIGWTSCMMAVLIKALDTEAMLCTDCGVVGLPLSMSCAANPLAKIGWPLRTTPTGTRN